MGPRSIQQVLTTKVKVQRIEIAEEVFLLFLISWGVHVRKCSRRYETMLSYFRFQAGASNQIYSASAHDENKEWIYDIPSFDLGPTRSIQQVLTTKLRNE